MSDGAAPAPSPVVAGASPLRWAPLLVALVLLVGLIVARVRLAHSINIHWDEFYFLSKVHSYARGELTGKLLTFHVHFLGWVRDAAATEVLQVLRLREVMLGFGAIAALATLVIGRRLIGGGTVPALVGASFAVLAGQSLSLVLNHGASARYDPIVVALFLVAGALLVSGGRANTVLAGVVTALCLLVSIKSALYLPTLLGLLLCRWLWAPAAERRSVLGDAALFAAAALLTFAPLLALHAASLAPEPAAVTAAPLGPASTSSGLGAILAKVVVLDRGLPNAKALIGSLRWDTAYWALLFIGVVMASISVGRGDREVKQRSAQLLCFALPLTALLFYRNSFHYFYVSVIPPAALLVGLVFGRAAKGLAQRPLLAAVAVLVMAAPSARAASLWYAYNSDDQLVVQKQIVDAVHETFPTPVPYVDRCAMIGSFKKSGPFMSTWTLGEYRKRGTPVMREALRRERPQFLLQNISSLEVQRGFKGGRGFHRLLREDFMVLKESFIPHWGPLWVAGKTVTLAPADGAPSEIDVVIAGSYRLEASAAVLVDGRSLEPGATVELAEGRHQLAATQADISTVTLRTASARPPPQRPPPPPRVFEGFRYRTAPVPTVSSDAVADGDGEDDPAAP